MAKSLISYPHIADGEYKGIWGGYVAQIEFDDDDHVKGAKSEEIKLDEGIRCVGCKCDIIVLNGWLSVKASKTEDGWPVAAAVKNVRDVILRQIEETFVKRMTGIYVEPGSDEYNAARQEFFTGAMAGMTAIIQVGEFKNSEMVSEAALAGLRMPPHWVFGIMRGDDFELEHLK